jgi:hypothetical protein
MLNMETDWLYSNKALIKRLKNVKHKWLLWGIFVVFTVFGSYCYLSGIQGEVGPSSSYYDAVLIFFGGFFGSAYWEGFKWAFTDSG